MNLSFEEMRFNGLLWMINRVVFHPRGYALAFQYPDGSDLSDVEEHLVEPEGFAILGDGSEPWNYHEDINEDHHFEMFNKFLEWCKEQNENS